MGPLLHVRSWHFSCIQIERGHKTNTPGILTDFCDGEVFRSHPLFSVHCGALQITLYYDDVEICNPLGSKRKTHTQGTCDDYFIVCMFSLFTLVIVGIFYFTLLNLHPKLRSKYTAIHLMALCNTSYIDKYSMNAVIRPFVDDLKKLVRVFHS